MRLLTIATIAAFGLGLAACGQTKSEAEADLAAKEAAANPGPAMEEAMPAEAAPAETAPAEPMTDAAATAEGTDPAEGATPAE